MRFWYIIFLSQLFSTTIKCNTKDGTRSKNMLPYFRRDIDEDLGNLNKGGLHSNDPQSHIAAFLEDNIKEIFSENDEVTEFSISAIRSMKIASTEKYNRTTVEDTTLTYVLKDYRNMSLNTAISLNPNPSVSTGFEVKKAKQSHMLHLSENSMKKSEHKIAPKQNYLLLSSLVPKQSNTSEAPATELGGRRSCIFCNNVISDECHNPINELIPTITCHHDDDLCYTLQTPFGIIDRGCINLNRDVSIYVCSCNLCNYISMAEMPYIFSNKRQWVHNVAEFSHLRNLRRSVFKDMACLKCEVNATRSKKAVVENENCLDGNVGYLPTEVCNPNEICAVKVIKSEGYVWRGCVKTPLYNYWYTFCDQDLCNNDKLISMYDFF